MSQYRFTYHVIASDKEGYYYDRWDQAIPVTVVAANLKEALNLVWAVQGEAPRGRFWRAKIKTIEPAPSRQVEAEDSAGSESANSLIISIDLAKVVTSENGWDKSRAQEVANCLENIAISDGKTWRAKVCERLAEQIRAQAPQRGDQPVTEFTQPDYERRQR